MGELDCKGIYGSEHINNTCLVEYMDQEDRAKRMILQEMNREIFTHPEELMEDIIGVTTYLRKKIEENGGDPERDTA